MSNSGALDKIKAEFLTQEELAFLFGVAIERIRDLRSIHKKDGQFIPYYQPTSKCILFHVDDVIEYIKSQKAENLDSDD